MVYIVAASNSAFDDFELHFIVLAFFSSANNKVASTDYFVAFSAPR